MMRNGKTALISLDDAARDGISRVRRPIWANKLDHLKIDIFDGRPGPWSHLYAPFNKECNGRDPVDILNMPGNVRINAIQIDPTAREYVPYMGPLPESDEYKSAVVAYAGALAEKVA